MALFGYVSDFIQRKITDSSRFFFLAHLFINCKCVLDLCTGLSGLIMVHFLGESQSTIYN